MFLVDSKIGVSQNDAEKFAKSYGMKYFEINSIEPESINYLYEFMINNIVVTIDNVPTPQNLSGKNIVIGRTLLENPRYKLALCDRHD